MTFNGAYHTIFMIKVLNKFVINTGTSYVKDFLMYTKKTLYLSLIQIKQDQSFQNADCLFQLKRENRMILRLRTKQEFHEAI